MQTRIVAIMMICFVALSGATAVSSGVSYTSFDSMNENNVTEVSVNATPTVSNSKQRRQYRLAYVSWKNRIADLRMSAIFKWLRTEYYPSLVSIADAASSGSSGVSFARDSMTIQDAWWDLDETMDLDLHRDSVVGMLHFQCHRTGICGRIFAVDADEYISELVDKVLDDTKDGFAFEYPTIDCPYCVAKSSARDSRTTPIAPCCPECDTELSISGLGTSSKRKSKKPNEKLFYVILCCRNDDCKDGFHGHWNTAISVPTDAIVENVFEGARDSKQLLKDMPRLPVFSRLEILEMARKQMIDNGEDLDKVNDWNDVVLPVNRFNFFKQLDIISDWACGEYGYENDDVDTEINSWKMPSFEDNGIDDRERRGSILVSISKRGLEVATALHQMKVAQEVLDAARDSKYMVVSSQDGNTFGACEVRGSGKYRFVQFRGSQTYPADQIRFKNKDEAIEFLCRTSGNYFWVKSDYYVKSWWNGVDDKLYNNMCVSFWETLENHRERDANNASLQSKYNARDSKKMKYTHYVQNESHLGIDKIEGNTKDELIAALFDHIASTSGYHEISEKDAVKSIIEDGNEHPNWQVWMREHTYCPDCMTSWIAISDGGSSNCICDARDSADSDSHTIDLTPSKEGYARMLEVVIKDSQNAADVEWATAELNKMKKQKRMSQFNRDGSMDLTISCNCGCGYTTRLEGQFPMPLGVESYYCSWIPVDAYGEAVRDSAWDDEKLSYAIELLSEKDLVKYQEWVDSQDGEWNGDGTISFANANAKLDYDMRELRYNKLQSDMGYCRETELLLCNLERHGFTLVGHRPYGYDLIEFNRTLDDEGNMPSNHYDIQNIIYDCWNHEETTLIVNHPSRGDREIGIRLVYGNEFGVLACDYSAPREYGSKPEWYVALKAGATTDINSIEEYEAITGSSMEYRWNDYLGRMSGKITFDDMIEDGNYKYKLCPKCLESGHENNQSYCHRYGASLSNGDTGSCIGYPSEKIARDSADFVEYEIRNLDTNETMIIKLSKDIYNAERNTKLVVTNLETGEQDINSIMYNTDVPEYYEKGSEEYNEWVSALVWKADPVGNTKWEKEHDDAYWEKLHDEQPERFDEDGIYHPNYARDSAEMAALVPSRYDENVSARELHPNVSLLNPDGFKWSDEQLHILNDFASWFQEFEDGTKPTRPRMCIESVAGSGKTTLVKELLSIINRFNSATKTIASAFNVHIAKILKGEIKDQQKNGFRGLEILGTGNDAKNTVSAGGYSIIKSHAKLQGISNVSMEGVEGKYLVLSKIVLAEYFGMISKPDGVKNANVGEVIRIMKDVCEFSQAAKPNYRNQSMKLARDLKKFVEALMGQGFVPTRSESKDLKEIRRIYGQIALIQGLSDTVLLRLPKNAMFTLARDVLLRSMDTWNSEKEVFPFAWTKNYSFSDVIVARTEGFAEGNEFERARFDSNNLYPLWKTLPRSVWSSDDKKLKTNMLFDHLSKAGLVWPPRSKESGRPTVSPPSGKPNCEVWVNGNRMTIDFRDGFAAGLKFKVINKKNGKVKEIAAWEFLKKKGAKSDMRVWTMDYNETLVKKFEDKYKNTKHGFKLNDGSSSDVVIEESRSKVTVSFSDHTWLPIALNLEPSADVKKDMAFVDEIQDLSVAKGSLIRKLIRNDGDSGLVLVGDSRQSIMQFSGSSATSMTDNATASNCVSYPMTICWRGSHEVAHSANRVMSNVLEEVQALWPKTDFPDYLSHKSPSIPSWNVGKPMENVGTDKLVPMVKELQEENPDVEIAVLSRVNQPLGAVILDLVTNGIGITTPRGEGGIVNSIKPILTNKYVEPKSPSQGIGIDMDNTNFKDLRSVRNRLEQVVSWAFNQSMIRNKGDADAAAKDEKFVTIEGNAELAIALIELWFREGVPSSTKHKDFVDWFKNVLLSSSGNPVHVSSVHRFKGGECDYAFILRSAKGKPDKETGECMPREIFMNKSMNDAPENAIAEACIMYVALTRSKSQNIQLWYELSGEEEAVQDPTRCVDCNAITHPDDHAVCIGCNRLLCNEYKPLRGPQGGLLHKGGEFDTTLSCGEYLPSADEFFDFTSTERSERNKHERYCDSCYFVITDNAPRDSADYRKQLEARDGIDRVYCLVCDKCYQSKDNSPIGFTIRYCCGQETETNQERIDFLVEYSSKPRDSQDDEDLLKEMDEDEICMWENAHEHYIRDSADLNRNDTNIAEAIVSISSLADWIEVLEEENDWIDEDGKSQPYSLDDTMLVLMLEDVSKVQMSLIRAMEERLDKTKHSLRDAEIQLIPLGGKVENRTRDSNDIRHELEQAGFLPANGATRVCCNCDKQAVFDVDTAIGTRSFCSEKCYAEYNGLEVMEDPNFYGMMLITRKPIETVYEVHLWTREIEGKKLGEFDEFFKFKDEDSARKLYDQITDYTYKILMQYDGDEGDVLLEYDNHDPHENMGHRDSTNAYIDECPECAENTCLNNVSTNPKYHDIECYSCGYYSVQETILIATPPYRQTKQIEGYMSEEEIEEMRADMGIRDSADFCNTCDAHIDLQGRDMLPRGMCIDCFIAQCREEMGIPNPIIVTDNWPENDPDEEPRDSSKFVTITLEEMDNFLVDAQGFRRLNPDEVGHYCGEWVYEYYLEPTNSRIRVYSSIPVAIHNSMNYNSATRGKGKDAIRCILLTGSTSVGVDEKCIGKATSTKRITLWRLNLLKKYEQWIWDALV